MLYSLVQFCFPISRPAGEFQRVPVEAEDESDFDDAADKSMVETDQVKCYLFLNTLQLITQLLQFIVLLVMSRKMYANMLKNGLLHDEPSNDMDLSTRPSSTLRPYIHPVTQNIFPFPNEPSNDKDLSTRPSSTLRPYIHPGVCPDNYVKAITSKKGDGFGAQFEGMMTVWLHAQVNNLTYCTRPWDVMAHNTNATEMFEYVGGKYYGPIANKDTHTASEKTKLWKEVELETVLWTWEFARRNYALAPKPELIWFKNDRFNIALHVRRGDVSKAKVKKVGLDMYRRYRGNNAYIKCMKFLSERYRDVRKPLSFHLFSEGEQSDFQSIIDEFPDTILHLDADIKLTHYHMVMADALVTAMSSFSRTAGFLSINDVYYLEGRGLAKYGNWIGCPKASSMRRVMASLVPYDLSTMISI